MKTHSLSKFLVAVAGGLTGAWIVDLWNQPAGLAYICGWVLFGFIYCLQSSITFQRIESSEINKHCASEDLSSWLLFSLVLMTCVTALVSISIVMYGRSNWKIPEVFGITLCILAVGFSWMVVHIAFTFRYAHFFYGESNRLYERHARGLTFPNDEHPDYWDFAYFSFTIGMTFQVSDVVIKSKVIRRLVLIHSIISFVFNTIIIALTINEMVNLGHV